MRGVDFCCVVKLLLAAVVSLLTTTDGGHTHDGAGLFKPSGRVYWNVGPSERWGDCGTSGWISSYGNGGVCPASPDGAGCAGTWKEYDGSSWVDNPSFTVVATTAGADAPLPAVFMLSGAHDAALNGNYTRTAHVCNGKPVYLLPAVEESSPGGIVSSRKVQLLRRFSLEFCRILHDYLVLCALPPPNLSTRVQSY